MSKPTIVTHAHLLQAALLKDPSERVLKVSCKDCGRSAEVRQPIGYNPLAAVPWQCWDCSERELQDAREKEAPV